MYMTSWPPFIILLLHLMIYYAQIFGAVYFPYKYLSVVSKKKGEEYSFPSQIDLRELSSASAFFAFSIQIFAPRSTGFAQPIQPLVSSSTSPLPSHHPSPSIEAPEKHFATSEPLNSL